MRNFFFIFLLIPGAAFSQAPENVSWVDNFSSPQVEAIHDGAATSEGEIYLIGSTGAVSLIVLKYNSSGSQIWAKFFSAEDAYPSSVSVDNEGNVYVAGNTFNPFFVDGILLDGRGAFLLKLNPSGDVVWAKTVATFDSNVSEMVVAEEQIYISGYFRKTTDSDIAGSNILIHDLDGTLIKEIFLPDNISGNDIEASTDGIYIAGMRSYVPPGSFQRLEGTLVKLSFDGDIIWVRTAVDEPGDYSEAATLAIDATGDIYIAGYKGYKYISKFNTDGDLLFSNTIDGFEYLFTPPVSSWSRRHWGMTTIGNDLYFVAGLWSDTPIELRNGIQLNIGPDSEVVVIKYNDIGYPQWFLKFNSAGNDASRTVFQADGRLVIAGTFAGETLTVADASIDNLRFNKKSGFVVSIDDDSQNECPDYSSRIRAEETDICDGESVELELTDPWVRHAEWFLDDHSLGKRIGRFYDANEHGAYATTINDGSSCPFDVGPVVISLETEADENAIVIIHPLPENDVEGTTDVCEQDSFAYTINASENNTHSWLAIGGVPDSGLDLSPEIKWNETGYIVSQVKIEVTGCTSSDTLQVHVKARPRRPSISQEGNVLVAADAPTYQWYMDEMPLEGATAKTLDITESGQYSVAVANDEGCTNESKVETFVYTALDDELAGEINLYPIPTSGSLYIDYNSEAPLLIVITDALGNKLRLIEISNSQNLSLQDLPPGVYSFVITIGEHSSVRRVVVL